MLISSRFNARGERKTPSRLLFTESAEATARRTLKFYGEVAPERERLPLLQHGQEYTLAYAPRPLPQPVCRLSVTAFKDYLACPYRFYLKHVLKLEPVDDECDEIDALGFGNLVHKVVENYGKWCLTKNGGSIPASAPEIAAYLTQTLYQEAGKQYGSDRLPSVDFQLARLNERLGAMAKVEARRGSEGWKVPPWSTSSRCPLKWTASLYVGWPHRPHRRRPARRVDVDRLQVRRQQNFRWGRPPPPG